MQRVLQAGLSEPASREVIKELLGCSGYREELFCHSTFCGEVTLYSGYVAIVTIYVCDYPELD